MRNILLIAKREYLEQIKSKAFKEALRRGVIL
jgi:hypothetical protein